MVIRTIRELKTTAVSEIPTATVDSETKTAVIRTTRITAVSGILKAADQNLLAAVDSGIAQAAKAPAQADSRAAEAALDKTIINKETNS